MLPIKKNFSFSLFLTESKNITSELTELLGARNISPIPPPFLKPWFNVVMMHIFKESQERSLRSPPLSFIDGLSVFEQACCASSLIGFDIVISEASLRGMLSSPIDKISSSTGTRKSSLKNTYPMMEKR